MPLSQWIRWLVKNDPQILYTQLTHLKNNCTYVPPGTSCEADINECDVDSNACPHQRSVCINTMGGFFCRCEAGYVGDGTTCEGIDTYCTCSCSGETVHFNIINGVAFMIDVCELGSITFFYWSVFSPDTYTVYCLLCLHNYSDMDECSLKSDYCLDEATCINIPGSFQCLCKRGQLCTGSCSFNYKRQTIDLANKESTIVSNCRNCTCLVSSTCVYMYAACCLIFACMLIHVLVKWYSYSEA